MIKHIDYHAILYMGPIAIIYLIAIKNAIKDIIDDIKKGRY